MEYYWGYAAASTPLPNAYPRGSRPTPTRSNSTKVVPTTRRSRIPGHRRTTSTDSVHSRPSHDAPLDLHQDLGPLLSGPPPPASPTPAGAAPASPADGDGRRERMPASVRYQNKQLPATPRLDTDDAWARPNASPARANSVAGSTLLPAAVVSAAAASGPSAQPSPTSPGSHSVSFAVAERRPLHAGNATMPHDAGVLPRTGPLPFGRTESVSSTSGTTASARTMLSTDPPLTADGAPSLTSSSSPQQSRPFVVRNGRTYLADTSLPYPLPVDLNELNRQSIRTMLLLQLFRGPICSPAFANKPPGRVLEVGCGTGFWSNMCHRYYSRHGHPSISFTGIDVARIGGAAGPGAASPSGSDARPDKDMKWRLVQHDMRNMPWPFADDEFDLVMVKDISLATTTCLQQDLMDEYLRILRPGGTLEIWESDHTLRMLRPHVPEHNHNCAADDEEEHEAAASLGAYLMTANTPLSAPLNNFLVEYNGWVAKALELRSLSPVPCTLVGPALVQEADTLTAVESRRLAVPLSEIKWEREGVGGVITKDGKSYIETKGKTRDTEPSRKTLTAGQIALRRTALLTVVQSIQNLEPMLREVSGKSQDEWDTWAGKMMNDLMKENGTSWGECLEVGAWWARKRKK